MKSLEGRKILITGGSRGIGLSIAEKLASQGAELILAARKEEELLNAQKKISSQFGSKVQICVCDVSSPRDVEKLKSNSLKEGPLFGLVLAAGIYGSIGPLADSNFEEWARGIEINLLGSVRVIHALLPSMVAAQNGRILLFSGGGQGPMPNFTSYVAGKGAIWRLVESLAAEVAAQGVFVNGIAPGAVNTQFLEDLIKAGPEKVGKDFYEKSLKQRSTGGDDPGQAAELCAYLMSEKSHGLYGKIISAKWDDFKNFETLEELSRSDIYTMKRVVSLDGKTRG